MLFFQSTVLWELSLAADWILSRHQTETFWIKKLWVWSCPEVTGMISNTIYPNAEWNSFWDIKLRSKNLFYVDHQLLCLSGRLEGRSESNLMPGRFYLCHLITQKLLRLLFLMFGFRCQPLLFGRGKKKLRKFSQSIRLTFNVNFFRCSWKSAIQDTIFVLEKKNKLRK